MEVNDEFEQQNNLSAIDLADEALGNLDNSDIFSTGKVRLQMAQEKAKLSGQPVVKHRNGKVDLGNVLDDPSSREFVCPYCSLSFAYKHVLERHVAQIHEKHLLPTLQCPKCTYTTVRKDQMRAHFSVVHEDFKPFNCSECSFRAPKAFRVTAHIQKNHGGDGAVIHDTNLKPKTVSPPPPSENTDQMLENLENQDLMNSDNENQTELRSDNTDMSSFDEKIISEERYFHCPHCDYKADDQLLMGDHVVINHVKEHISRNAKPPKLHECNLCQKKVPSLNLLQSHVRAEHPDVVVL